MLTADNKADCHRRRQPAADARPDTHAASTPSPALASTATSVASPTLETRADPRQTPTHAPTSDIDADIDADDAKAEDGGGSDFDADPGTVTDTDGGSLRRHRRRIGRAGPLGGAQAPPAIRPRHLLGRQPLEGRRCADAATRRAPGLRPHCACLLAAGHGSAAPVRLVARRGAVPGRRGGGCDTRLYRACPTRRTKRPRRTELVKATDVRMWRSVK